MGGIASTEWLAEQQGGNVRILDMRASFAFYEEGHIPGAQFLHIETLRLSDDGVPCKMMPTPLLAGIFGQLGISHDTPVVLYTAQPNDIYSATYGAWSLAVTGNRQAHILNGGLTKWQADGREITAQYPEIPHAHYEVQFNPEIFADWAYVRDHLTDPNVVLVDTRSHGMYIGAEGPTIRLGHIPGAVLHDYAWDFQRDGTYQPVDRLRQGYERAGITPDKEVITYCVTGREGSAAWYALHEILGYPRVRLYQASLTEWAAHPDLPMVTGEERGGLKAA